MTYEIASLMHWNKGLILNFKIWKQYWKSRKEKIQDYSCFFTSLLSASFLFLVYKMLILIGTKKIILLQIYTKFVVTAIFFLQGYSFSVPST